jgi:hypothetical protein
MRIGGSCLGLSQTKTMLNSNEVKYLFPTSMKREKTKSVVVGGHPAGLMLSVIRSVE